MKYNVVFNYISKDTIIRKLNKIHYVLISDL